MPPLRYVLNRHMSVPCRFPRFTSRYLPRDVDGRRRRALRLHGGAYLRALVVRVLHIYSIIYREFGAHHVCVCVCV